MIGTSGLFPPELLDGMIADYLAGREAGTWLTGESSDGVPVSVAFCAPEQMASGTWNLLLIAVHQDHQRRGHGGGLLQRVEAELASVGRLLLVETSGVPEFEATRAFYRAHGYDQEAQIRDFYEPGDDKIVFRKLLG